MSQKNLLWGINNKVLLYNIGNYIEYPMVNHNGKEYEKEYITESLHFTVAINTTLYISYTSIIFFFNSLVA